MTETNNSARPFRTPTNIPYPAGSKEYKRAYHHIWYAEQKKDPLRKLVMNLSERLTQKKRYIRTLQARIDGYDKEINQLSLRIESIRKEIKANRPSAGPYNRKRR